MSFLNTFFNGKLNVNSINKFLNTAIEVKQYPKNRKFPRVSLLPFSKWYVKKYHKSYNLSKIINAIKTDTIEELNKNLKSKANKMKNKLIFNDENT